MVEGGRFQHAWYSTTHSSSHTFSLAGFDYKSAGLQWLISLPPHFMNQTHSSRAGNKTTSQYFLWYHLQPIRASDHCKIIWANTWANIIPSKAKKLDILINLSGLVMGICRILGECFEIWEQLLDLSFDLQMPLGVWEGPLGIRSIFRLQMGKLKPRGGKWFS